MDIEVYQISHQFVLSMDSACAHFSPFLNPAQAYVVFMSFIISFWVPVVMKALGASLSAYTFGHLWMYLWLCIMVFMGTSFSLIMTLGEAAGNLLQLIVMMLNYITSGLQPIELAPSFYHIGYGLPMFQCSQGSKHIVFGSFSSKILGRNIGVLFAWFFLLLGWGLYRARRRTNLIEAFKRKEQQKHEEGAKLAANGMTSEGIVIVDPADHEEGVGGKKEP